MRIPRLLLLPLLLSVCVAPVVAQSSPDNRSSDKHAFSSQSQLDGLTAPSEFRSHVPTLSQRALDGISGSPSSSGVPYDQFKVLPLARLGPTDTSCFYMRTYRVTRDEPQSDTTRGAGYSTCQLAGRYQTKNAVEVLAIAPR
jgi:hypothetical protein